MIGSTFCIDHPRFLGYLYSFLFCLVFQFLFTSLQAQQATDTNETLKQKFEQYSFLKKDDKLFLHTDKTLYTNNETIWFTGYLENSLSHKSNNHNFLSVYLCRQDHDKMLLEHRFLMKDGISFGNITLPDTIPPGNYTMFACTNVLGSGNIPVAKYRQQLIIASVTDNVFKTTTTINNSQSKDFLNVEIKVVAEKLKKEKKPMVSFLNQNDIKEVVKEDINGKYFIKIALEDIEKYKSDLVIRIDYKDRVKYTTVKWPKALDISTQVKFYPEGGNLINGVVNQVAWEVKNSVRKSLNSKAVLYRGNEIVDTIETEGYGIGKFKIIPDTKYSYSVKLINSSELDTNKFLLPKINTNGITLNLQHAVVNDTLSVSLICNKPQTLTVLVHDYNTPYAHLPMQVSPGKLRFDVDLKAMPKGVGTITILDSMQRPIIERLFFAHYNHKNNITISTNELNYFVKDSTKVKIKLTNEKSQALQSGIVSIAVVQNNRIESDKQKRIDSYFSLENELKGISTLEANLSYRQADYLENILMVKGWRKYVWSELAGVPTSSTADTLKNLTFSGSLSRYGVQIKRTASIILISDSSFKLINTDRIGDFTLAYNDVLVSQNKKVWMMVNEKSKEGYKISFQEPRIKIAQYFDSQNSGAFETADYELIPKNKGAIILNDVIIKGHKSDLLYKAPIPKIKTNLCGDYLCSFRHLNCQNVAHLYNTSIPNDDSYYLPTHNQTFITRNGYNSTKTANVIVTIDRLKYAGCWLERNQVHELTKISGIEISKEFYQADQVVEAGQDDYRSTTYWNHGILVNDKGEVDLSFKNSQLADKFKIVIQGTTDSGVIYGEQEFKVNEKSKL